MFKGASGGGWFKPWNDSYGGTIRSNNSYVFWSNTANGPDPYEWRGPYLGNAARDLWKSARTW